MRICAATGNAGKLRELRRILEAQGHEVVSQKELGITIEPDETGTTFEANAPIKPRPSARPAACPPSLTIPASAWTRWTALPASTAPATAATTATTRPTTTSFSRR